MQSGMQIGDYELQQLLYEGGSIRMWQARQISVNRPVIVEILKPAAQKSPEVVAAFVGDVRTKAQIDHPYIGSVFEVIQEGDLCMYTREMLNGRTLLSMQASHARLSPAKAARMIEQFAQANDHLERHGIATLPVNLDHVYIADTGMCRLINMAVSGEIDPAVAMTDKSTFANALIPMLEQGKAGSVRIRSLLDFMADMDREEPLSWAQITELAQSVQQYLTQTRQLEATTQKIKKKKKIILAGLVLFGLLTITMLAALCYFGEKAPKARSLNTMVSFPAGNYRDHEGQTARLDAFSMSANEVTIAQYAAFLDEISEFNAEQLKAIHHPAHPSYKVSHKPDDWKQMYRAARAGKKWNGLEMTLNCPVVGIDWWDAYAYAKFAKCELPTQKQWFAALTEGGQIPPLSTSAWGEVDQQREDDKTAKGIYGLAGNVAEWILDCTKPAGDPTNERCLPVICGGSYFDQKKKSTDRLWLNKGIHKDARDNRSPYVGFRTVINTQSNSSP